MRVFLLGLAAALSLGAAIPAWSQASYPSKPVKVLVGFTPGSAADIVARIVAQKLGADFGQPFVIENRPGAGSSIAAEAAVRSPPDGYTLLMGSVANTINATLAKDLPFEFDRDLVPIVAVASVPNLLVVNPSVPARSVQELIAIGRANPGDLLFGSSGKGTSPHLSGELFGLMAGLKLVHVPYKGSPQAVADLLAGRVSVMFSPASTVLPHVRAGTLRALASSGAYRSSAAPDLPTIAESGLPGFETSVWLGLLAPAATPHEIVERLNEDTVQALGGADVKAQLVAQGIDPMGGTPQQFAAYIRQETEKWARVVQAAGARLD